jgi:hypothetical protein
MDLLDKVTWPKPLADILDVAYDAYRGGHPWVSDYQVEAKSVARDLYERAMTFGDYVAHYSLARSEGLLLRYLSDAYKALTQTVPEDAKTEELYDLTEWLGELVRQVDSSLLAEWERLSNPDAPPPPEPTAELDDTPPPVTANTRAFRVLVRNELFRRVELAALRRFDTLGDLDGDVWTEQRWRDALAGYFAHHADIGTGPDARGPALLMIDTQPGRWVVRQILDDPAGDHDWGITAEVDLPASDAAGTAVIRITAVDQL